MMKVKELIRLIERDGWYLKETRVSHRQYIHPLKKRRVTVPGKMSNDIHPKTLKSILNQTKINL